MSHNGIEESAGQKFAMTLASNNDAAGRVAWETLDTQHRVVTEQIGGE
jgi:hypothetical protein